MKILLGGLMALSLTAGNFAWADTVTLIESCTVTPRSIPDVRYTVDIAKISSSDERYSDFKAFVYNSGNIGRTTFATYELAKPVPNGAGIVRFIGKGFKFQLNTAFFVNGPTKSGELFATSPTGQTVSLSSDKASGSLPALISCE